ncbi:hypothetical protein [Amycolatopsis sp. NPDC021455]|jgi:hypothetical protein|uniref:hypothetical protein n=1 Tax=Amycolatopsis sp. NPDC021455 TaxID=3154901 RepID=UPI0033EF5137
MPMYIDNLSSRVHVATGDLPFTDAQLDRLADLVRARLARHERDAEADAEATRLYRSVAPADPVRD